MDIETACFPPTLALALPPILKRHRSESENVTCFSKSCCLRPLKPDRQHHCSSLVCHLSRSTKQQRYLVSVEPP